MWREGEQSWCQEVKSEGIGLGCGCGTRGERPGCHTDGSTGQVEAPRAGRTIMGHRCVGESRRVRAEAGRRPSPGGQGERRARDQEELCQLWPGRAEAHAGGKSTGGGRQWFPGLLRQQGGRKPGRPLDVAIRKSQATCHCWQSKGSLWDPCHG